MKQFILPASLLISATLFSSIAAASPHNWTGYYVGLNAGAVQHSLNMTDNQAATFNGTIQENGNPELTGGVQVGYRKQLDLTNVSGIYGVEFSANLSNASFSQHYGTGFSLYELDANNKLNDVCLLQATGGIAADKTLLFVAAGLSWVNISGNVTNVNGVPFFTSYNVGKQAFGTALGGGFEYAFTDKISARFKVDVIRPNSYSTSDNVGNTYQISNNIVQGTLGINYKFG